MSYRSQEHRAFPLPGDRPRYAPDRTCDVRHIKLEVSLDLGRRRLWGQSLLISWMRDPIVGATHLFYDGPVR